MKIAEYRRRIGLTQVEMAKRIATTQPTLSRLESGHLLVSYHLAVFIVLMTGGRVGIADLGLKPSGQRSVASMLRSISQHGPAHATSKVIRESTMGLISALGRYVGQAQEYLANDDQIDANELDVLEALASDLSKDVARSRAVIWAKAKVDWTASANDRGWAERQDATK